MNDKIILTTIIIKVKTMITIYIALKTMCIFESALYP